MTNETNIYTRLEFDLDGQPILCTYKVGQPYFPILVRKAVLDECKKVIND
jgi:hypothetical protein